MNTYRNLTDFEALVGSILGTSEWLNVDQKRINQFAAVTADAQWLHVDADRAAVGMYGTTVAHGFLTLSLLPFFGSTAYRIEGARMSINYGLNRVRFPAPVPVDSRLRDHIKLLHYELIDAGVQMVTEVSIERDGHAKPVCVAETIARHYF